MTIGVRCAQVRSVERDGEGWKGVLLHRDGSRVNFDSATGLVIGKGGIFTTTKQSRMPGVGEAVVYEMLAEGKALRWGYPISRDLF